MKLSEMIKIIDTDEFVICYGEEIEFIFNLEEGNLEKYYNLEVTRIVPTRNAVEIYLK